MLSAGWPGRATTAHTDYYPYPPLHARAGVYFPALVCLSHAHLWRARRARQACHTTCPVSHCLLPPIDLYVALSPALFPRAFPLDWWKDNGNATRHCLGSSRSTDLHPTLFSHRLMPHLAVPRCHLPNLLSRYDIAKTYSPALFPHTRLGPSHYCTGAVPLYRRSLAISRLPLSHPSILNNTSRTPTHFLRCIFAGADGKHRRGGRYASADSTATWARLATTASGFRHGWNTIAEDSRRGDYQGGREGLCCSRLAGLHRLCFSRVSRALSA